MSEKPTRRDVIQGVAAGMGALALGCKPDERTRTRTGTGAGTSSGTTTTPGTPTGTGTPTGATTTDTGEPDPCTATSTMTPAELLAHIDTFVVLCLEDRSFDHFLGSLSLAEGKPVDGLVGTESNDTLDGTAVPIHELLQAVAEAPPSDWNASRTQWNGGANDGFVRAKEQGDPTVPMGYHTRAQLPATYQLADNAVVCDRWFASVMGPSWPNRFYLHGATSEGNKSNVPVTGFVDIFDLLSDAGISWKNYHHSVAWATGAYFRFSGLAPMDTFFDDAAAGTLPRFSVIDPSFFGTSTNSDAPGNDMTPGQDLVVRVFNALAQSPQWDRCLFVLTYASHGGFYDHVPPPTTVDERPEFTQLGFRVPAIVAGPTVRRGCTVSTQLEHVSVISTLTRRFGLATLNGRVQATNDLSSCIDPALIDDPQPATLLDPV